MESNDEQQHTKEAPKGAALEIAKSVSSMSESIGGYVDYESFTDSEDPDNVSIPLSGYSYSKLVKMRDKLLAISAYNPVDTAEQKISRDRVIGQLSIIDLILINAQITSN